MELLELGADDGAAEVAGREHEAAAGEQRPLDTGGERGRREGWGGGHRRLAYLVLIGAYPLRGAGIGMNGAVGSACPVIGVRFSSVFPDSSRRSPQ